VHRLERRVLARLQRGRLLPQGAFPLPPGGTLPDLDGVEAGRREFFAEPEGAQPLAHALVTRIERFPPGQHDASAGSQDPAQLAERRVAAELDRVDADHRVGVIVFQSGAGHVGDPEDGVLTEGLRERPRAAQRLFGEVDSGERGPGAAREFQTVRSPAASQVEQPVPRVQPERVRDLRYRVPGQQAVGDQWRGHPQVPAHDLVPYGERRAVRVPFVEALGGHDSVAAGEPGVSQCTVTASVRPRSRWLQCRVSTDAAIRYPGNSSPTAPATRSSVTHPGYCCAPW
jgi:hypothetical protein